METNYKLNKNIHGSSIKELMIQGQENYGPGRKVIFILSAIINSFSKKRIAKNNSKKSTKLKAVTKENKKRFSSYSRHSNTEIPKVILDAFKLEYFTLE